MLNSTLSAKCGVNHAAVSKISFRGARTMDERRGMSDFHILWLQESSSRWYDHEWLKADYRPDSSILQESSRAREWTEWSSIVLWPTSTIFHLYAHCCSAELRFFSSEHFLALQCISRLCRVFFSCHIKHFSAMLSLFLLCQAFFFLADHLFPLSSIFLLCWGLLSSSEHFSTTLRTSRLFQSFLFYAERCFGSSKHFQLCWTFFLLCQAFFGYAEHF